MLSYLIKTTTSLFMVAVMLGVITSYTRATAKKYERMMVWISTAIGVLASIVMSIAKNTTSKIDTSAWNLRIFSVWLGAFLIFMVFSFIRKPGVLLWCALSVISAVLLFYTLPDVWAYPYQMLSAGQELLSTDFLYKIIGFFFGWVLNIVVFLAAGRCVSRLSEKGSITVLRILLSIYAVRQATSVLQILLTKRIIKSNHTLFTIAKYATNYSDWFIYLMMITIFVITILLWARSFHVNEPYANPAEHRKIRAKWRNIRRWATTAIVAFILCILNMTVIKAYDSRVIELSPIEECREDGTNVYVTFDQVSDGHLHRFAYTSPSGIEIRFIIIKKPNGSSYGIGLDACDICGETGYYEKDGQVVCKLCDVVMNINTIGFKGGCNPIVVPYEMADGQIILPIEGLMEYESEFR